MRATMAWRGIIAHALTWGLAAAPLGAEVPGIALSETSIGKPIPQVVQLLGAPDYIFQNHQGYHQVLYYGPSQDEKAALTAQGYDYIPSVRVSCYKTQCVKVQITLGGSAKTPDMFPKFPSKWAPLLKKNLIVSAPKDSELTSDVLVRSEGRVLFFVLLKSREDEPDEKTGKMAPVEENRLVQAVLSKEDRITFGFLDSAEKEKKYTRILQPRSMGR